MRETAVKMKFDKTEWKKTLIRLGIITIAAWILFRFLFQPMLISGSSMIPAYPDKGFTFSCPWLLWLSPVKRGDVAVFSMAGRKVYLLKRVLAFEGETVEWRKGQLYINGRHQPEPYVSDINISWNIPPEKVEQGKLYVMGDNRSMSIDEHVGGQISRKRLAGKPLW